MKYLISGIILFILDGVAMFVFSSRPAFFFPAYRNLSKNWMSFLANLSGFVPFTLWDIIALILLVFLIISFIRAVQKRKMISWLSRVFLLISLLCFVAVQGWMLNHYAPPLSEELGMNIREYSQDELYEACEYYLLTAAQYAQNIDRDAEGHAQKMDFYELAAKAGEAYGTLADEYPVFKGSMTHVKRFSLIGEYLLYNGIIGMFMPLDGEAGVPYHVPDVPLAYTMSHEAAHRLGLASEQEANFAAFLACINSSDSRFIYSGYYQAFGYVFNALYKVNSDRAMSLYQAHKDEEKVLLVWQDRYDTALSYQKYDSPLQDVSDQINDAYLKTFSEESGIQSYGEVADYLIAWYLDNK